MSTEAPAIDVRAWLDTRLRALLAEQQQFVAQANAAAGAIELCQQLLQEMSAPPPAPAPEAGAPGDPR